MNTMKLIFLVMVTLLTACNKGLNVKPDTAPTDARLSKSGIEKCHAENVKEFKVKSEKALKWLFSTMNARKAGPIERQKALNKTSIAKKAFLEKSMLTCKTYPVGEIQGVMSAHFKTYIKAVKRAENPYKKYKSVSPVLTAEGKQCHAKNRENFLKEFEPQVMKLSMFMETNFKETAEAQAAKDEIQKLLRAGVLNFMRKSKYACSIGSFEDIADEIAINSADFATILDTKKDQVYGSVKH